MSCSNCPRFLQMAQYFSDIFGFENDPFWRESQKKIVNQNNLSVFRHENTCY